MSTVISKQRPFDRGLAKTLLRASAFAYCNSDDDGFRNDTILVESDKSRPQVWRNDRKAFTDTSSVCVIQRRGANIVAFRGTESSVLDWLRNFKTLQTSFRIGSRTLPGAVHQGFLEEVLQVWGYLLTQVKSLDRTLPLYATGHSQGGALAVLATAAFEAESIPVAATYTFAAPRPGDADFVNSLSNLNIHRVEFSSDIVPHVPRELPAAVRSIISRQLTGRSFLGKLLGRFKTQDATSRQLLELLARLEYATYRPAGRLTWIDDKGTWHSDLTDASERQIAITRLMQIAVAGSGIAECHRVGSYEAAFQKS